MNEQKTTNLEKAAAELETKMAEYRDAIASGKDDKITLARAGLVNAEKDYQTIKAFAVYDELGKSEKPIEAAIKAWHFDTIIHKDEVVDHTIVGASWDKKEVPIDLLKFCQRNKLEISWYNTVECLNLLMCIATAKEMGYKPAQIKQIKNTYAMKKRSYELLDTVSKNTIERNLQEVIDALVFEPNADGKNTYKVYNKDITYLIKVYTRKGKDLVINTAGHRDFVKTITNIAHRIVVGDVDYEVGYKHLKDGVTAATIAAELGLAASKTKKSGDEAKGLATTEDKL